VSKRKLFVLTGRTNPVSDTSEGAQVESFEELLLKVPKKQVDKKRGKKASPSPSVPRPRPL
jgi:hypothetical protein